MLLKPQADWPLSVWLDFLENRHQKEVHLRLLNPKAVAERMGLLEVTVPVVTVTGTNGKGSTVQMLEAIYQQAGYRVGSYTSPHLISFNERIRVNHVPISDGAMCEALWQVEQAREDIQLTYFEAVTLAALWYFKSQALDIYVLEVGVGGRLDATNIIDADVAIITTVDLDHEDYLGHDKEAIGLEKAGIMRAHGHCIYGDVSPPTSVVSESERLLTHFWCYGRDYAIEVREDKACLTRKGQLAMMLPLPRINLKAAAAAMIASDILSSQLPITPLNWEQAMQMVQIAGRQQWVTGDISILYDVAHNPQAVRLLVASIQRSLYGTIHAVFSGLKDKQLITMIQLMSSVVDHWYPALLDGKRASSEAMLTQAFEAAIGHSPPCYAHPRLAFNAAKQCARVGDLIVVFGSFLLVGAVMEEVQNETNPV